MGQLPNPSWPVVAVEVDFTTGPPNTPGVSRVSLESRGMAVQQLSTTRGMQYELGHAEAGTCNVSVSDPAENLNPANGASPFNTGGNTILPYRAMRVGAWWNVATKNNAGNLLNSANTPPGSTTAFDPTFETTGAWWGNFGTGASLAQTTTQAWAGTHSLAVTCSSASDKAGFGLSTVPGLIYTVSLYVYVPAGVTVTASFATYPALSALASATSTTTGAWQRLTMTATATDAVTAVTVSASAGTYPVTFYVDAVQAEFAATATTFTPSGPSWYPVYTGYVERYPSTWVDSGFRGVRPLVAVDALSVLSRTVINQSYQQTIMSDSPTVYIPYDDQAVPQVVQLPQGGQPAIGYSNSGNSSGSVNFQGDTFLDGSNAVSVVQQNANPPVSNDNAYITYLGTNQGLTHLDPNAFTIEAWVKWTSGTPYIGAADVQPGEAVNTEPFGPNYFLGWYTSANGTLGAYFRAPDGTGDFGPFGFPFNTFNGYPDGQWHYLLIALRSSGGGFDLCVDDDFRGFAWTPGADAPINVNNFFVDATTVYGTFGNTQISVANMAVYSTALPSAKALAHYNRGTGYINEVSGARAARLLGNYWTGGQTVATGYTKLSPDYDYNTRTVLDVLNEIADTEGGRVYTDRNGIMVFEDRASRYISQTSAATFGENSAGGELPYEAVEYDFDPTYVFSQANLTRPDNSDYAPQVNATSQENYGQRILSQELKVNNDFDLSQAASFYLTRYAAPKMRVRKLTLNPATNPALWSTVLGLELSQRVTVKRRTSAGTVISGDYYVEQINHSIDASAHTWTVDLQLSPVFVPRALVLGDASYGALGAAAGNAVIY
jgi:hypothetical protein